MPSSRAARTRIPELEPELEQKVKVRSAETRERTCEKDETGIYIYQDK